MRNYTYDEIERMRRAVTRLLRPQLMPGTIVMGDECGPDWNPSPQYIESTLQTYILAGVEPYTLEAEASARETKWEAQVRRHQQ